MLPPRFAASSSRYVVAFERLRFYYAAPATPLMARYAYAMILTTSMTAEAAFAMPLRALCYYVLVASMRITLSAC